MIKPALVLAAAVLSAAGAGTPHHAGGLARSALAPHPPRSAAGTWTYDAPTLNMRDGARLVRCSMSGVTLTLAQTDTALSGGTKGGVLRCEGRPTRPVTDAPISGGAVRGDSVFFVLGPFVHRGRITGRSIQGGMMIPNSPVTGRFRLARQP